MSNKSINFKPNYITISLVKFAKWAGWLYMVDSELLNSFLERYASRNELIKKPKLWFSLKENIFESNSQRIMHQMKSLLRNRNSAEYLEYKMADKKTLSALEGAILQKTIKKRETLILLASILEKLEHLDSKLEQSNPEDVIEIWSIIRKTINHASTIQGNILQKADLRGADLKFIILEGAKMQEADLRNADLSGADLREANLYLANLQGAKMQSVNLVDAALIMANLKDANLSYAYLRNARFKGANLQGADLRRADLRESNFEEADLQYAKLQEANLRGANLWKAILTGATAVEYQRTDLIEAKADISNIIFIPDQTSSIEKYIY